MRHVDLVGVGVRLLKELCYVVFNFICDVQVQSYFDLFLDALCDIKWRTQYQQLIVPPALRHFMLLGQLWTRSELAWNLLIWRVLILFALQRLGWRVCDLLDDGLNEVDVIGLDLLRGHRIHCLLLKGNVSHLEIKV